MSSYFHENKYSVPGYSCSSEIVIEEEISPTERNQYLAKEPVEFEKILQEEIIKRYKNTLEHPQYYSMTFEPGKGLYDNFVQKRQEKGLPDTNLNFFISDYKGSCFSRRQRIYNRSSTFRHAFE